MMSSPSKSFHPQQLPNLYQYKKYNKLISTINVPYKTQKKKKEKKKSSHNLIVSGHEGPSEGIKPAPKVNTIL